MYNGLVKTKKACAFVIFSSTCYAVVHVVYGFTRSHYVIGPCAIVRNVLREVIMILFAIFRFRVRMSLSAAKFSVKKIRFKWKICLKIKSKQV